MVLNVIVVDDSALMRLVIARALRMLGLPIGRIDEAADGVAALAALRTRSFDLAIVDVNMPHMNGIELIEAIGRDAELSQVSIVVVSTEASKARLAELRARAVRFLRKPFDPERLLEAVVGALGGAP
jgi:two-component system, chemotaxis family, chemotaxis protein CheY